MLEKLGGTGSHPFFILVTGGGTSPQKFNDEFEPALTTKQHSQMFN